MEITWLGILAIAILIFTGYGGYRKGFVREIMFIFLCISGIGTCVDDQSVCE